jgi:hypothetical protein
VCPLLQSLAHNHNALGLMRAADTRMAGHFIAFQRMLRLKNALSSTITSSGFVRLKVAKEETKLLKDDMIWKCIEDLVRAAFPALRVLRLADKKTAGMDKLYYYVRKTDNTLTTKAENLNQIASKEVKAKLKSFFASHNVGSSNDDSDDSDDSSSNKSEDEDDTASDVEDDSDDDASVVTTGEHYKFEYLLAKNIPKSNIAAQFRRAWGKRRKKLIHDYSVTGWMLSPIPAIMEDAKQNHRGWHRDAVD